MLSPNALQKVFERLVNGTIKSNETAAMESSETPAMSQSADASLSEMADRLADRLETYRSSPSLVDGHTAFVMNIDVPFKAIHPDTSPFKTGHGFKELTAACERHNVSLAVSRKIRQAGFYVVINPGKPYLGLEFKAPTSGLNLDIS